MEEIGEHLAGAELSSTSFGKAIAKEESAKDEAARLAAESDLRKTTESAVNAYKVRCRREVSYTFSLAISGAGCSSSAAVYRKRAFRC
jgi:hypothetical protein